MTNSGSPALEIASEPILVVDLVDSTAINSLYGWNAVGRGLMRDLRQLTLKAAAPRGCQCIKSTGDGYLLAFRDPQSADLAALHAIETSFELLDFIENRNQQVPEERMINLRFALHFGEVDVVENDREGPAVTYTFRIEELSHASLPEAINPIPPEEWPLRDYILCSEEVAGILTRKSGQWVARSIGLFRLKGFTGLKEVFLVNRKVSPEKT